MFKTEFTISDAPETLGLKKLQLDYAKLSELFTIEEVALIHELSFYEETVKVPIIENGIPSKLKFMYLDSFAIGIYDLIKGGIKLVEDNPECIGLFGQKTELAKQILYKYNPDYKNKFF